MAEAKFVQIVMGQKGGSSFNLYALDESGQVWEFDLTPQPPHPIRWTPISGDRARAPDPAGGNGAVSGHDGDPLRVIDPARGA